MICINKYIQNILNALDIKNYYLERPQIIESCIVYTFIEYPKNTADGIESHSKYDCYFNLIVDKDISKNINIVKKILLNNGFKKVVINNPYKIKENFYEITMNFTKIMESEEY